jgi:hypothetical protein
MKPIQINRCLIGKWFPQTPIKKAKLDEEKKNKLLKRLKEASLT